MTKVVVKVGDVYPTNYWGDVTVIEANDIDKLLIEFVVSGNRKVVRKKELVKGAVSDKESFDAGNNPVVPYPSPKKDSAAIPTGAIFPTNMYGDVEVVSYHTNKNIVVKFINTGNVRTVQKDALEKGLLHDIELRQKKISDTKEIEDKRRKEKIKERKKRERQIEKERRAKKDKALQNKIEVEVRRVEYIELKKQRELDYKQNLEVVLKLVDRNTNELKQTKGVVNFDFKDRDGKWVLRFRNNCADFIQTRIGKLHNGVTQRTKEGGSIQTVNPTYIGVGISDEFKDAQKFGDWCVQQEGWDKGYQLDKDLLSGDNPRYSAETCCFLPGVLNRAIKHHKTGKKTFIYARKGGTFRLNFRLENKDIRLSGYDSEQECTDAYKEYRQQYVQRLAEEYRGAISEKAYEALMLWELKIT